MICNLNACSLNKVHINIKGVIRKPVLWTYGSILATFFLLTKVYEIL